MRKILTLFVLIVLGTFTLQGQELLTQVKVQAPGVQITDKSVFTNLESLLQQFMNGKKWTNERYEQNERIKCSFVFTINSYDQQTGKFGGQLQVNYSRPIYNSTYNSPVLNWIDNAIQFTYIEGSPIDYVENQHLSNMTSILAYYAYVIIGLDKATYEPQGGEVYFVKARGIAAAAQNDNTATGWRSFDSNRNRYWLVDNLLNPGFAQIINTLYAYHRLGLDKMYDARNQAAAKLQIKNSLLALKDVHQRRPGSFIMQIFMEAKSDEIVNIFTAGPEIATKDLVEVLQLVDGPRASDYDAMLAR